jgi:hypothetical protein
MPTNFYGEVIPTTIPLETPKEPYNQVSQDSRAIIEVDMNEVNLTLFQVIHRTRKVIDELSSDRQIAIYFVSGFKAHNTYDFWNEYFDYISSIPNLSRITIVYRGYIHLQNLGFFFIGCPVLLNKSCKIVFDSNQLFDIMKLLSQDPQIYGKFTSRFLGFYRNLSYIVSEDLNELSLLGFTFSTF